MDMTWSSGPHYPLSTSLAFLFTIAYAIWCAVTIARRGSARPGFLAVVPFLASIPIVWWGYVQVIRAMSISGGGRAALAAGLAEALWMLCFGAAVSAVLALVTAIRGPRHGSRRSTVMTVFALAAAAGVSIWFAPFVLGGRYDLLLLQRVFFGSIALLIAIIVLLLIGTWRHPPAPLAVAAINLVVCIAAWQQIEVYRRIAMTGF